MTGSTKSGGRVFHGRFTAVLVLDEGSLDAVGRYLHLNPVGSLGLGLGPADRRRALIEYTTGPIRQGVLEGPWEREAWGTGAATGCGRWRDGIWGGGWRRLVSMLPGSSYAAAAHGIHRFRRPAPERPETQAFEKALIARLSNTQI